MNINSSNLLSLTIRKNRNTEYGALKTADVPAAVQNCYDTIEIKQIDTISENYIHEYETTMSNVKNLTNTIITNCENISDQELIDIYTGSSSAPGRLYIKNSDRINSFPSRLYIVRTLPDGDTDIDPDDDIPPDMDDDSDIDPDDDIPPDADDDTDLDSFTELPTTINYTLQRKTNNNTNTISVGSEEIYIKLTNSTDGKTYYYKISSNDSNTHNVKLTYMDNDRFLIEGDHVSVTAYTGQEDNIILMGSYNYIDTNSGNDTVRVGIALDTGTSYFYDYYIDNIINTGSGSDYVQNFGQNQIDTGKGSDYLFNIYNSFEPQNVEHTFEDRYGDPDTDLGWAQQGQFGDCKFLSFLNSFNNNLDDYVEITESGSDYIVKFKKSGKQVTVKPTDLNNSKNLSGDLTNKLIETAFRKVIEGMGYNMDSGEYSLGRSDKNWLISKVLFGQDDAGLFYFTVKFNDGSEDTTTMPEYFKKLMQAYLDGEISNLVVGTTQTMSEPYKAEKLGIFCQHAYAVVTGVPGSWIELTNPWDSNDTIKLDWATFLNYFSSVNLFGDSYNYCYDDVNCTYLIYNDRNSYRYVPRASGVKEWIDIDDEWASNSVLDEINEIETSIENVNNVLYNTPYRLKFIG